MDLWCQLGHGAVESLVGGLLTLDKARERAPGLLVAHMCFENGVGPHLHRYGVLYGPAATPCLRFHSLTELLSSCFV